ncbi:MAG: hypothetical protein Q8N47_09035 [Bryobacterales bacterium]|nr:hypothetical protein [Bryobacterales bacterium]
MSTIPINNVNSSIRSVLNTALQSAGLTTRKAGNGLAGIHAFLAAPPPDHSQLSPFAQLMSTFQQLQQSDPAKYQQVTGQIAANLQAAAQTAQADGKTTLANQLTQLAADFTNASTSSELPNIQDLIQALGSHRHQRHSDSASADSGSASSSASHLLDQIVAAFRTPGT